MEKYVLSQRSSGLGDCIFNLYFAYIVARRTKRTLIIDWSKVPYSFGEGSPQNKFLSFFQEISHIEEVPVILAPERINEDTGYLSSGPVFQNIIRNKIKKKTFRYQFFSCLNDVANLALIWPGKWSTATVINPSGGHGFRYFRRGKSDFTVLSKFLSYLKPLPHLQEKIDQFSQKYFSNKKVIAIHMRGHFSPRTHGRNKSLFNEEYIKRVVDSVEQLKNKFGSDSVLFLCTDTEKFLNQMRNVFPDGIVYDKSFPKIDSYIDEKWGRKYTDTFHYSKGKHVDRERYAFDSLIEMFLLAKADGLVVFPADSSFSFYARHCAGGPAEIIKVGQSKWKQYR